MPVLQVTVDTTPADALLRALATGVAAALGLAPDDVIVRAVVAPSMTGSGAPARWATVVVQGRDRGPEADRAVASAVRSAWPDDRLSVGAVRDLP